MKVCILYKYILHINIGIAQQSGIEVPGSPTCGQVSIYSLNSGTSLLQREWTLFQSGGVPSESRQEAGLTSTPQFSACAEQFSLVRERDAGPEVNGPVDVSSGQRGRAGYTAGQESLCCMLYIACVL